MEHPITDRWQACQAAALAALDRWSPAAAGAVADPVQALLAFQRSWEERVLFPRLARYFVGGGPVPVMTAEHRDLEARWAALDLDDAAAVAAFRQSLRLHCRKEELSLQAIARIRLSRRDFEHLQEEAGQLGLTLTEASDPATK